MYFQHHKIHVAWKARVLNHHFPALKDGDRANRADNHPRISKTNEDVKGNRVSLVKARLKDSSPAKGKQKGNSPAVKKGNAL